MTVQQQHRNALDRSFNGSDEVDKNPAPILQNTTYGFSWGPIEVTRLFERDGRVVIGIKTIDGKEIQVYSSRTGKSLRVYGKGVELLVPKKGPAK